MPAPSSVPTWATDANYTNGPVTGTPTKVAPSGAIQAEGHVPGTPGMAQRMNWWKNLVGQWVEWLQYLSDWFDEGTEEFVYPSTKTRTKFLGVSRAILGHKETDSSSEWEMADLGTGAPALALVPVAGAQRARAWIPLDLPQGAIITGWTAYLEKGASNATTADQWGVSLYARGGFTLFPGSDGTSLSGLGTLQRAGSGTGRTTVGESGLSHTVQGAADYYAFVEGPVTEHANDRFWGVSVAFTDPGPRNA